YVQWRALTVVALKLDVRVGGAGAAVMQGGSAKGNKTSIIGRALFYAAIGLMMAGAVVILRDRVTASMVVSSYVIVVVATAMLVDLSGVVLSPTDYGVLGFQPISSRTYFAAKLTNVLVYTLAMASLVGLPPVIAFAVRHGATAGLAAVAALYACAVSVTLAIVTGYARLARAVGPNRLRGVLSWAQLAVGFFVYGGYFVVSDLIGRSTVAGLTLNWSPWLLLFPGTWFAGYTEVAAGPARAVHVPGVLASIALMALLARSIRDRLSLQYVEQLGALATASEERPARRAARRLGLWFARGEARAVVILVWSHFRNDLRFRMGVFAILPITLIYLIMGLGDARDAAGNGASGEPNLALVTVAALLFPTMLKANLTRSEAFRASWIFFATPADRTRLIQASRRMLVTFFIVPYLTFVGVVLAFITDGLVWLLGYL
ncbi:MAG TPA: hypothetical protein VFJ95_07980, partial [Gammaproteobacteria bacterium]|nr:hypothetical protein [Gammaproteobacteria bacterium]